MNANKFFTLKEINMTEQISVAQYFTEQVDLCGKSQVDIAKEMGFDRPNVISNIKNGNTKMPLARIGLAAESLGVDSLFLLKMVVAEYFPADEKLKGVTFWNVIDDACKRMVTAEEYAIVLAIRKVANNTNPKLCTAITHEKLAELAVSLS